MSERDIPSLLQDILVAIGNIKDFTRGITFEMYLIDLKIKHAVERNFSIIGEALARIDNLAIVRVIMNTGTGLP